MLIIKFSIKMFFFSYNQGKDISVILKFNHGRQKRNF